MGGMVIEVLGDLAFADMQTFDVAVDSVSLPWVLIDDLVPGRTYEFKVRAFNESAVGELSVASTPVTIPLMDFNSNSNSPIIRSLEMTTSEIQWGRDFYRHFRVERDIGRGRYALVKKAFCLLTNRPYAVKCISRYGLETTAIEKEHLILCQLRHRNIVQAFSLYKAEHDYLLLLQWYAR